MSFLYKYLVEHYPLLGYFRQPSRQMMSYPDFSSFQLIGKLPFHDKYNGDKFIPTIHYNANKQYQGLYLNTEIECADDIAYHASQFKNINMYAHGLEHKMKSAMMQAAANLSSENAKYIVFKNMGYDVKYGNSTIAVLKNNHPNGDPNMTIVYELSNII
jgi:hypothetical protein